mmetsp:Transcript_44744/g.116156  ORF Transcript_44744/g.116156 Transcript_44744/m.116156 type:complete len:84 (+) Transcript_44744:140-391(+)
MERWNVWIAWKKWYASLGAAQSPFNSVNLSMSRRELSTTLNRIQTNTHDTALENMTLPGFARFSFNIIAKFSVIIAGRRCLDS